MNKTRSKLVLFAYTKNILTGNSTKVKKNDDNHTINSKKNIGQGNELDKKTLYCGRI